MFALTSVDVTSEIIFVPLVLSEPVTSSLPLGLVVPIPTELAEESTNKVPLSQFKSPVPPVSTVSVPTLVMLGCAAVASVPVIDVLAVKVVNVPAAELCHQ